MTLGLRKYFGKFLLFSSLIIIFSSGVASAFIYANATNDADTYLRKDKPDANFGDAYSIGAYGTGVGGITAIMRWALPKGSGNITKITLNMFCYDFDNYPITPVELHVLNEGFDESGASWNSRTVKDKWTNPGAWMPISASPTVIDETWVDKPGIYSWVLKGKGAINSLDTLSWGDTINLALMLPNQSGYRGAKCYSKENPYFIDLRPYIVVTDETATVPTISNIDIFKVRKTNALILSNTDVQARTRIKYGTDPSNLNNWSVYEPVTRSPHNLLTELTPGTTYYYSVYSYNYIDANYSANSSIYRFTTDADTTHIPLVTFVFDDNFKSAYDVARPILNASLFSGVEASDLLSIQNTGRMNFSEVQDLQNTYSWEIMGHTVNHARLTELNDTLLDYELNKSKEILHSYNLSIYNFASPYGHYSPHTNAYVMKYYDSDRATWGNDNSPPYKEFPLFSKEFRSNTTVEEAESLVDNAINNNSWLIFTAHNIVESPQDYLDWSTKNLTRLVKYIESKGKLRAVTIREAQTTPFDYKGIYAVRMNKSIANTVSKDGNVNYSKSVTGHIKVNMTVLPSIDTVKVIVYNWSTSGFNNYSKKWNESSSNPSVPARHIIGDFPPNTYIQIKKNGATWEVYKSNSSGYINYEYDAGLSDIQFEASAGAAPPSSSANFISEIFSNLIDFLKNLINL